MRAVKILMFLIGVFIVLVGLALILSVRIGEMQAQGQAVGPQTWVSLIDSVARLWERIFVAIPISYLAAIIVLLIGIVVMSIPIALPKARQRQSV